MRLFQRYKVWLRMGQYSFDLEHGKITDRARAEFYNWSRASNLTEKQFAAAESLLDKGLGG